MASTRDLPVIQKVHDLILWFIPILNRYPVIHRRGIGEQMADEFEHGFIHDCYANREGFGTHRILRRWGHLASAAEDL